MQNQREVKKYITFHTSDDGREIDVMLWETPPEKDYYMILIPIPPEEQARQKGILDDRNGVKVEKGNYTTL